eukprot:TRINITY_DN2976_c0_g1_i1.p1 TRINITY_DN2976_c0_g1~~TRINITY_DN2976_c0_g1_i1.p1  ORF type:complete len:113 (+),score=28.93 TRINITY_DN2976_c0_g1_i1:9-347(+)
MGNELNAAIKEGHLGKVKKICKQKKLELKSILNEYSAWNGAITPVHFAIHHNQDEIIIFLLSTGDVDMSLLTRPSVEGSKPMNYVEFTEVGKDKIKEETMNLIKKHYEEYKN